MNSGGHIREQINHSEKVETIKMRYIEGQLKNYCLLQKCEDFVKIMDFKT